MATSSDIETRLRSLTDEELLKRIVSGSFTEVAHELALAEVRARGLPEPPAADTGDQQAVGPIEDLLPLARLLEPTEAHLVQGFLQAQGIGAVVTDVNLVQANSLLFLAVGGVRVLVPASKLDEAIALMAARDRGEFRLADDEGAAQAGD